MKKSWITTRAATVVAMVIFAPAEARAESQAQVPPDIGINLHHGNGTQAAAGAGAFATSNQAQTQIQASASTATGGQGGVAYNAGNHQIMNLGAAGVRNNPNIGLGLMVPTAPCRDTYSVGGSAAGMGGGVAWSKADRECRWQDIGAAFIRAGFIEDGLAMWCAIEGVEDIAPTCKRLKTAKHAADSAKVLEAPEPVDIPGWSGW